MKKRYSEDLENDPTPSREVVERYREDLEIEEGCSDRPEYDFRTLLLVHYRGTREELELGLEYCASEDPLDRVTGADILAQLGWGDVTFRDETVNALIRMLDDPCVEVVRSAAIGLGSRDDPRAVPYLAALSGHYDSEVRFAVSYALGGREEPEAIQTLIRMTKDLDSDVRDWAVFGLGTQLEALDTPEIRTALIEALDDLDDVTRCEAIVGLARRGDDRVLSALIREWGNGVLDTLTFEATEFIADPRLIGPLTRLLAETDWDEDDADDLYIRGCVEDAIAACRKKKELS